MFPSIYIENDSDYNSVAIAVTFEPCEMRKCINVSITDDMTVEEVEESFFVRLEKDPMMTSMIILDSVSAVVTIRDDDGMYLCIYNIYIIPSRNIIQVNFQYKMKYRAGLNSEQKYQVYAVICAFSIQRLFCA